MHVGRAYPYHPSYWSGMAWFWPGWVPWKVHCELGQVAPPPFSILPFPWSGLSGPGEADDDGAAIDYTIRVYPELEEPYLVLTLDRSDVLGVAYARWRCTLRDGGGAWGTAFLLQEFPQRVVSCPGFEYVVPAPPYTGTGGPEIRIRPATYAEGGSPFPNY